MPSAHAAAQLPSLPCVGYTEWHELCIPLMSLVPKSDELHTKAKWTRHSLLVRAILHTPPPKRLSSQTTRLTPVPHPARCQPLHKTLDRTRSESRVNLDVRVYTQTRSTNHLLETAAGTPTASRTRTETYTTPKEVP